MARKSERYTRAVNALENLLSWWASLGDVEQASKATIARLIQSAEGIISEEQVAWTSTGKEKAGTEEANGDGKNGQRGSPSKGRKEGKVAPTDAVQRM